MIALTNLLSADDVTCHQPKSLMTLSNCGIVVLVLQI
jgi:hypothetical protein